MTEISVKEQIRKLVELQKIDAQIYQLRKESREKPVLLEELKREFESKTVRLKELEEQHKRIQVKRREHELDLKTKEESIAKANSQLSQIKTNKEYTAKLTEIESIKADKSLIEEKILISYDEADGMKAVIEKEKSVLAVEEKRYSDSKKEIEDSIKEVEAQLRKLEDERKRIVPDISRQHLERYERILINKEGLAIVPVQSNVCGGCYMNIPPQVVNEIKMYDRLILCELCARILYLEEDL